MKRHLSAPVILALALFAIGCTTTNTAGRILATTSQTVHSAMQGWGVWVATGNADANGEARVRTAYRRYQLAMDSAQTCYNVWQTTGEQSYWTRAEATLVASRESLLNLIAELQGSKEITAPPVLVPLPIPPVPPVPTGTLKSAGHSNEPL